MNNRKSIMQEDCNPLPHSMEVAETAEDDVKINCWSCKRSLTMIQRSKNDGFCPHCDVEIDLLN